MSHPPQNRPDESGTPRYDGPTDGYERDKSGYDAPSDGYNPTRTYDGPSQYDGPADGIARSKTVGHRPA